MSSTWGITRLDAIAPIPRRGVTVLAHDAGIGGSSLAWQAVLATARTGDSVLVFHTDSWATRLTGTLAARIAGVPEARAIAWEMDDVERAAWSGALAELSSLPIDFMDSAMTVDSIREAVRVSSAAVVLIDRVNAVVDQFDLPYIEANDACIEELGRMAHECDVAVLAVHRGTRTRGMEKAELIVGLLEIPCADPIFAVKRGTTGAVTLRFDRKHSVFNAE